MHPWLTHHLPSYGIMILIGFASGMLVFRWHLKSLRLDVEDHTDRVLWIFLASFAGARLFHVLFGPVSYQHQPWRLLAVWDGGLSFQGGFFTGALATWFMRRKVRLRPFLDAAALGLILGHFWGRLGCILAGCCWGKSVAGWPLGFSFPAESVPALHYHAAGQWPSGTPLPSLIPVQAYEAIVLLALFLGLLFLRRKPAGTIFTSYLILYGIARFWLEMLRGDPGRGHLFSFSPKALIAARELPTQTQILFSVPQFVSLMMIVLGVWLHRRWKSVPGAGGTGV